MEHKTTADQLIAPKERLAICLYVLIRGDYYYAIAKMAGHGLSTISYHQREVQRQCMQLVAQVCDFSRK